MARLTPKTIPEGSQQRYLWFKLKYSSFPDPGTTNKTNNFWVIVGAAVGNDAQTSGLGAEAGIIVEDKDGVEIDRQEMHNVANTSPAPTFASFVNTTVLVRKMLVPPGGIIFVVNDFDSTAGISLLQCTTLDDAVAII